MTFPGKSIILEDRLQKYYLDQERFYIMEIAATRQSTFYKDMFRLALPIVIQNLITTAVSSADVIMLGWVSQTALSAGSLASQIMFILNLVYSGIASGVIMLAAQYWGAGNSEKVRETFSMALRLALGAALFFTVLTLLIPDRIMRIYTSEQAVIDQGVRYLRITAFIFAIHGTGLVAAQLMRSVGQAKLGLVVSIISFVVNILANYIFIFGKFGAPRMEDWMFLNILVRGFWLR